MVPGSLCGRHALITGGASGIGLHTALALARLGASVSIVDRNAAAGAEALARLQSIDPSLQPAFVELDLARLGSVRAVAGRLLGAGRPIDVLVNNAGLLPPQKRATTADGFELGFGISVLGHYALTGLLLPLLLRGHAPRVVWTSSIVHGHGRIDFADLGMQQGYEQQRAYAAAKLGSLLLAFELQRRAGSRLLSVGAHPGIARTHIGDAWHASRAEGLRDRLGRAVMAFAMKRLGQDAAQGALPLVHAAASPGVAPGAFYGPDGFMQFRGAARRVQPKAAASDAALAARLWDVAGQLTGVRFEW